MCFMSYLFCLGRRKIKIKDRDKRDGKGEEKLNYRWKERIKKRYYLKIQGRKMANRKKDQTNNKKNMNNGKLNERRQKTERKTANE